MKLDIQNNTQANSQPQAIPTPSRTTGPHLVVEQHETLDETTTRPNHSKPELKFGPIWVREAQRIAESPQAPVGDTDKSATSPAAGPGALQEILCQPPTQELHRDSLRHAFLSLSSSF